MINKSLFKQSCKANGIMWTLITVATCFMLACVMLIAGNGNVSGYKDTFTKEMVKSTLKSEIEERSLMYYDTTNTLLETFDDDFKSNYVTTYTTLISSGLYDEETASTLAIASSYQTSTLSLIDNIDTYCTSLNYIKDSDEYNEIYGVIMYTFNPLQEDGTYMFDSFYTNLNEEAPRYTAYFTSILTGNNKENRDSYVMKNTSIFLANALTSEETVNKMVDAVKGYGITLSDYQDFGFTNYSTLKEIAGLIDVSYQSELDYKLAHNDNNLSISDIKKEINSDLTSSFITSLPSDLRDAISDIIELDIYGLLVGSIYFKMAGLLLPIIFIIMTSNNLIAGQVDSGSMAYILSSSIKRNDVTRTQGLYLTLSCLMMSVCTTITSLICFNIVGDKITTSITNEKLILLNLGSFLVMFAISGINFMTSSIFNRSKHSMGIGGGISMFFLVATMLGLFGSQIIPSIIRMDALNIFNYVTLISLFDVINILDLNYVTFIYKFAILFAIGLITYIIGQIVFKKKDLPL